MTTGIAHHPIDTADANPSEKPKNSSPTLAATNKE
jgi:hypothetical protein